MKVILAVVLTVASVSGLGSGPYLPSGWRPRGTAFYLPSEIESKPDDNPLKEILFQESEASGSDSLREYGPPKLQEVSNEISNQGLPDSVTEQIFQIVQAISEEQAVEKKLETEAITEQKAVSVVEEVSSTESAVVEQVNIATEAAIIEEKTDVAEAEPAVELNAEVGALEPANVEEKIEVVATEQAVVEENAELIATEPVIVEEKAELIATEPVVVQEKAELIATEPVVVEEKTETIAVEPIVAEENAEVITKEPIVVEENAEVITKEPVVVEEKTVLEAEAVFESRALGVNAQAKVELTTQISVDTEESSQVNFESETTERIIEPVEEAEATTVTTIEAIDAVVNVDTEVKSEEQSREDQVANVVQQVVEEIQTEGKKVEELNVVVEEVRTVEEGVKTVQEQVQNIGEALVILENEVKAKQIQSEVKISQELSGSLEQAPEGFLEYGPPGFREYGPPKGDELLRSAVLESINAEPSNELRKRRFSPKFKTTRKGH